MPKAKRVPSTQIEIAPSLPVVRKSAEPALRALTQYSKLPPGHKTFHIADDQSVPHLKKREFAVIDTLDRKLQHGELYLTQYSSGSRPRKIIQATTTMTQITATGPKQPVWWTCCARGFHEVGTTPTQGGGIRTFAGLSDGPYLADSLQAKLIGRVVGFAATALGDLLPDEEGYENEAAGNAAFDPAEYLDTLIGAGYRPYCMKGRDGHLIYGEGMPDRASTKKEDDAVMAVRWKWCRASTALERIKAECERRGL